MTKKLLTDCSAGELKTITEELSLPKFRAAQLFKWLAGGAEFDEMTDLPKGMRETLTEHYESIGVRSETFLKAADGTVKFLFRLNDGNFIESVLMSYKHGYTLCISTQVGCRMGCVFCASGFNGLARNLTAGEMLGQIIAANKYVSASGGGERVSNVVLMGSGEPLDNYDNVTKFIRLAHEYLNIGQRSISVSTCGLVPAIKRLADDNFSVTLCISLHETTDEKRKQIMPIANKYSIGEIISAAKYYFDKSGRRVLFEYALIAGQNNTPAAARRLRTLTASFPTHINLIPLNATENDKSNENNNTLKPLIGPSRREAEQFCKLLTSQGASATVRRTLAPDIQGACGQLRSKYVSENKHEI